MPIEIEMPKNVEQNSWRETYEAVLRSQRWTKIVKPLIASRAGNACERCGATESLSVHHLTYERLGKERPSDLLLLCERCHEIADRYREIKAFGNWLEHEGKHARNKPIEIAIPEPFNAVELVRTIQAIGTIKLTHDEERKRNAVTGELEWVKTPGSEFIYAKVGGSTLTVYRDPTKNREEFPLRGRYEEIAAVLQEGP